MSEIVAQPEQLDLFADIGRWPRRPYCTDDLAKGLHIRSLATALTRTYIQVNPAHLRVWAIFDIDRPGAAAAWEDGDLPPPTWTAINRTNGRAHSVWGLKVPVLVDGLGARDAPLRYLCAIESMMAERLKADAGYCGLATKNPVHPLWLTLRGPRLAYSLAELAEYLPGIERHQPKRRAAEQVGLGRNVTLFDRVRQWAYRAIRPYWGSGLPGWNAWLSQCNSKALTYNADFPTPLHGREVWHVARSVAKWTWRHTTAEGFSAWQASAGRKGGKASGEARRQVHAESRTKALQMASESMSQRRIAAELGVTQKTISLWLRGDT